MVTDLLEADDEAPLVRHGWRAVPDRLRGLHADRRGQILPLIFFLGVAFFSSVLLVVNTGRTVNFRIENQNAVDAAAVSGATSMARGMNYLASNNIAQARLLSVVVVLRAIPKATDLATQTLKIWEYVVVPAMKAAAQALKGSPFTVAIGVAIDIAAEILKIKIKLEKIILKAIKKVIVNGFGWFDKAIKTQTPQYQRERPKGLAWTLMRGMSLMGQGIAYWGPVVSQWTAQVVYRQNLSDAGGFGFALLAPLYPGMPICKAGFARFQPPLADDPAFVSQVADPIIVAGWVVLTLSFWPLYFNVGLNYQMKALFRTTGPDDDLANCPDAYPASNPTDYMDSDNCEALGPDWKGSLTNDEVDRCRGACRKWWLEGKSELMEAKQIELREKEVRRSQIGSDGLGLGVHDYRYKGELAYWEAAKAKAIEARDDPDDPNQDDRDNLDQHGNRIGEDPHETDPNDPPPPPPPPDPVVVAQTNIDRLEGERDGPPPLAGDDIDRWKITAGEIPFWRKQRADAQAAIAANNAEIRTLEAVVRNSSGAAKSAAQARISILEDRNSDNQDTIDDADAKLTELIEEDGTLNGEVSDLEDDIDDLQRDIDDLTARSTEEPSGDPPSSSVEGGDKKQTHTLDKKYFPYLLNVPDGAWPRTFTVFVIAGRGSNPPLGATKRFFGIYDEAFENKMPLGFAYAGARVLSPEAADLWISNWRAKLVRVRTTDFPAGADMGGPLPKPCTSYPGTEGEGRPGDAEVEGRASDAATSDMPPEENPRSMRDKIDTVLQFFNKH